MASHVRTAARLDDLRRLLKSIEAQQPEPPRVFLSWSCGDEALRDRVRMLVEQYSWMSAIEQPTPHSQFEHYRALTAMHAPNPPQWVMFSDDDDVWSETRAALYRERVRAAAPLHRALLCRRKTQLRHAAPEHADADGVRALLQRHAARLSDCNLKDGIEEDEYNMAEYFDLAVRFDALKDFFERMPRFVTNHRLCDLSFCFLMQRQAVRFMPDDESEFVYFYSRGGRAGGASGVSTSQEDADMARLQFGRAPPAVRLLLVSEGGGEETFTGLVVSYVATLRQGLEQEFIQFRACGGVAPHDLVSRACLHQADKNLQSWCMSRPAMRSEPLLEWSRALADGPLKEVLLQRFEFEAIVDAATWEVRFIEGPVHRRQRRTAEEVLRQECANRERVGPWRV